MSYSFETSYQPYLENQANNKQRQCDEVLSVIKTGADNLLRISELIGIPQAIVSARCNDLINENKIQYKDFTTYKYRKRKKIILINPVGTQANLF